MSVAYGPPQCSATFRSRRPRRVLRAARALGIGQIDAPAAPCRFNRADAGRVRIGASTSRRAAVAAQYRHGVPELRAVAPSHRARMSRSGSKSGAGRARRSGPGWQECSISSASNVYDAPPSGPALRRATAARGDRPHLAIEPRVLLLDEPLSNLDAKLRGTRRADETPAATLGITTIFVTHAQQEAMTIADRLAVLDQGADPASRYAARAL